LEVFSLRGSQYLAALFVLVGEDGGESVIDVKLWRIVGERGCEIYGWREERVLVE